MRYLFTLSLLLILTSCTSAPMYTASNDPDSGYALVYIYWLPESISTTFAPGVIVNDTRHHNIISGTYLYSYLKASTYEIGLKFGLKRLSGAFDFQSGRTYFIKVTSGIRPAGLPNTLLNFRMRVVDSVTGSHEIKATRLAGELVL